MENKYLAKTEKEKTIKEHTQDLINQYEILKKIYPNILDKEEWDILSYAIKYHDIGKINTKFQNKLYKALKYKELLKEEGLTQEVWHNFLSPLFINTDLFEEKYGLEKTKILLSSVYYHHDREEMEIPEEVIEDLKKQVKGIKEFFDLELNKIEEYSRKYILNSSRESDIEILAKREYILIKGILNRLDYVASLDKNGVNIEEIIYQEGKTISELIKQITKEKYNNQYREVQRYMMENTKENLVVISYTGSGKTEAALLWIENSKAFYTLPLKVSINAIYKRIKDNIKYDKVLLLHSDAQMYYQNEEDVDINKYDRARRMSSPLIITTVDQLFKIAFKYRGYEEILSTISYSKIIIDEIQMYSPELLAYIFVGLSMINKVGGKFAIITATFPPLLYNIMDKLKIPYKKQEEEFKPHISNRHKIQIIEDSNFNYEEIINKSKNKKILIIVNTIKKAQEIYDKLKKENTYLLHSHYIKQDRDKLEEKIMIFGNSESKENGIWISTQIVEASLDIDFDILYTEACSIDSLFQRMGRVYRKRAYSNEEQNVYILNNRNGVPYIIDSEIYEYTMQEIMKYNNENISESDKQIMINNIFSFEKNDKLKESKYYKKIRDTINLLQDIRPNQMPKREIDAKFRDIQNISLIPDKIYEHLEKQGIIEEWHKILKNTKIDISEKIKIKDEIKKYIINVQWSPNIQKDETELFYKGSNIYRTRYLYEFNNENLRGKGLIIEKQKTNGYFDE